MYMLQDKNHGLCGRRGKSEQSGKCGNRENSGNCGSCEHRGKCERNENCGNRGSHESHGYRGMNVKHEQDQNVSVKPEPGQMHNLQMMNQNVLYSGHDWQQQILPNQLFLKERRLPLIKIFWLSCLLRLLKKNL